MFNASSKKSQIDENEHYRFGPFTLETSERVLRDGDAPLAITPKAFDILLLLVRNHGHLVSKQRLLETIWPNTFVEESTLTQNIFTLRKTLGREYIETVPKHGYRFCGEPPEAVEVRHANRSWLWIAAAVVVVALLSLLLLRGHKLADTAFRSIAVERLTNGANISALALSPDGKYIAYASTRGDMQSLLVRQIATATAVEIVPPAPLGFRGITFSRHGEWIYYVTVPQNRYAGTLYRIPLLGGTPQRVLQESVGSRVELSPDGSQIAYVHWIDGLRTALKIVNADGSGERQLATLEYDDGFAVDGPAWSPDGKTILAATRSYNGSRPFARVVAIDLAGGGQRTFLGGRWNWIGQMSWLADGSGVVLTAWNSNSEVMSDQVWLMSYPSGETRRISNDINGYLGVGVSPKLIAASTSIPARNFWVGDRKITNGSGELYSERLGAAWMPDGRVVFASRQGGSPHIWIMDADGNGQRQLTSGESFDLQPAVSPDGASIAFVSNNHLWRMNADGSNARRLAAIDGVSSPAFSPDGRSIICAAKSLLWRIPADGGTPVQLTRDAALLPAVSPDGKWIACLMPNDAPGPARLTLLAADDGRVIKQFATLVPPGSPALRWSPDGRAITYVVTRDGVSNIRSQAVDGGAPAPLTDWKADVIYRFDWSRDGRLLCERGTTVADVILVYDKL
ncbi:MAG TPA: winged helix-turn-helix domain-containing protein [Thermoanaerobaculia bacterium]|nr:winged helix-turn-helix domain-containing protein [Thermoanaerobaculia bacterium]